MTSARNSPPAFQTDILDYINHEVNEFDNRKSDQGRAPKLLGHCNIRTTQIFAKIVDEQKRKAVNLIPKL